MIVQKGTEPPFSGEYDDFYEEGIFVCRRCNAPLFSSNAKFDAGCSWPAFDEHFPGAVTWTPDADGQRTEITCSNCGAHLGIVFKGEQLTEKTLGIVLIHCRFGFKRLNLNLIDTLA